MSRKGNESKKRRIAKSRRRRVGRNDPWKLPGTRAMLVSMSAEDYSICQGMYRHLIRSWQWMYKPLEINKMVWCSRCCYSAQGGDYCGLGMSPDVRGCNHRELLMEESYD